MCLQNPNKIQDNYSLFMSACKWDEKNQYNAEWRGVSKLSLL